MRSGVPYRGRNRHRRWLIITQPWALGATGSTLPVLVGVPASIFIWGGLGGSIWTVYWSAYWNKRRLFDDHYLAWYFAMPAVGAVAGAALVAVTEAGLIVLTGGTASGTANTISTTPATMTVSFVSGLFADRLLDVLRPIFGKLAGTGTAVAPSAEDEAAQT